MPAFLGALFALGVVCAGYGLLSLAQSFDRSRARKRLREQNRTRLRPPMRYRRCPWGEHMALASDMVPNTSICRYCHRLSTQDSQTGDAA